MDNIYVTGKTRSLDFPTQTLAGAYNQSTNIAIFDSFILKFDYLGQRQWCTTFGGSDEDEGITICADNLNNIYIAGQTLSQDFPTLQFSSEYWQPSNAGGQDLFLIMFTDAGARKWATYYGSVDVDFAPDIKVDSKYSLYLVGEFGSNAFTIDYGNGSYYDDSWNGGSDGMILKIKLCNNQKPYSVQTDRNNICINDNGNITLTAINGVGDTLKWYSDNVGLNYIGKDTPIIIPSPTQTTTYYARWESICDISAFDNVIFQTYTEIKTNQNQKICPGDTCTVGNSFYTMAGIYIDTIPTLSGCDSLITTNLTVNPVEQTVQYPSICDGESFICDIHSYKFKGIYMDTLTSVIYGCDSIITTNLSVNPIEQISTYPSICEGESISVGTHNYTSTGVYSDVLKTYLACDSTITTHLTVNPLPLVSLGDDRLICPGDSIILSPGQGFNSYLWSDGSVLSDLIVTSPGTYQVTVFNDWCSASAEMNINECGTELWFPNAFSPNNDNKNESFKPVKLGTLNTYYILIYNQWGQQVYESNDAYTGWDGSFKGSPCATGPYVYVATYTMGSEPATQKLRVNRGAFTLLR